MRTEVHCKRYFSEYNNNPMRNLNEDSSRSIMPLFYSSKSVPNGQYRNGFMSGIETNGCPGHGKVDLKQKILEHEAVFKNQVCELHRLYSIQRGMMDCGGRASVEETLCSSNIQGSEEAIKRHMASLTMPPTYGHARTFTLGVEAVDSCISCKKQNSTQPNFFRFHNGSTRDCEVLGLSPSKVQKKFFDLQRPPDDYLDGEEERKLADCKLVSDTSDYAPNGNLITDSQGLKRRSIGFYDLNEPIKTDGEDVFASSFDFLSRSSVNGDTSTTLDVSDGVLKKSNTGRKAGLNQNNTCPVAQDYHYLNKTPLLSQSSKGELDQFHHVPRRDPTVNSTGNFWRDRHGHGLKSTDRIHGIPNNNHLDHITSWPLGSWAQSVLPWAKSSSDSAQKMTTFDNSSRTWQPSILSQEQLGVKWQVDSSTESNRDVAIKLKTSNGYYYRSGSGSQEPARFGFLNGSFHADSFKSGIGINSNGINSKISSNKAVVLQDLNIADTNNALEDHLPPLPCLKYSPTHCTNADSGKSSYFHATSNHLCCKNETIIDLNQPGSSDHGTARKNGISANQSVTKILGVPISDQEIEHSPPDSSWEVKNIKKRRKNQAIDLNLACEPDELIASEELIIETKKQNKGAPIRDYIDLNSCVDVFEDPPTPYNTKKVTLHIDLEVPASMESEDDASLYVESKSEKASIQSSEGNDEQRVDVILKNAATIMIDMSSLCFQSHTTDTAISSDPLLWFVNTIFSFENEVNPIIHEAEAEDETTVRCSSLDHNLPLEIDEFEAMTLQLQESKEEEYMHKHFIPQIVVTDEAEDKLPTRSRARRGRQRKNFQRDVLPGMTSLSRHEVSEDLQTLSKIMRAMGHSWSVGARGRRRSAVSDIRCHISTRSMQKTSNGEVGFEDRSLTGWGKITRRPRRQRCGPTGNHQMYVWA